MSKHRSCYGAWTLLAWFVLAGRGEPLQAQKLLADGVQDLATQIASKVQEQQKQKIAVLPFRELDGQATVLGTYLAEDLVTHLFNLGSFDIVERTMLDRLLGEVKLGQSGLIDPETAREVGKIAGVDAVVTGTITDLQSYVAVNCRLIDAERGHVFAAAQVRIAKDDDVRKILDLPMPESSTAGLSSERPRSGGETAQQPRSIQERQAIQERREQDFTFSLEGCTRSGTTVRCDLLVTNNAADRQMNLYGTLRHGASRLYDERGNAWQAVQVVLGNQEGRLARSLLVQGIASRAQVRFEGVAPEAQVAALLELYCWSGQEFRVQFRDVPLIAP